MHSHAIVEVTEVLGTEQDLKSGRDQITSVVQRKESVLVQAISKIGFHFVWNLFHRPSLFAWNELITL